MPIIKGLKEALLKSERETDFVIGIGDFNNLEVRAAEGFHFFYDRSINRLIKNFVIREGPQVDTMCGVVLVKTVKGYSPRLRLWKRDKTSGKAAQAAYETLEAKKESLLVKASVDLADSEENLWRLFDFLRSMDGIDLPPQSHVIPFFATDDIASALNGREKSEILSMLKTHLGSSLTERDIQLLTDRRQTLEEFNRLLHDESYMETEVARLKVLGPEGVWQNFFESHPWIFGFGLRLVTADALDKEGLEAMTTGANVFSGAGKRIDAVMRTRGFIQSLQFVEIKRHNTPLLRTRQYRPPDVYQVSNELSGAVSQVQKTTHKAIKRLEDLHRQHSAEGEFEFEVSTVQPRQVVLIGNLEELTDGVEINVEKMTSFELYRRGQIGVEIITYDELYSRAKLIVDSEIGNE